MVWDLTPIKKGSVPVAHGRGGPINIFYEIHGSGPKHLVVNNLNLYMQNTAAVVSFQPLFSNVVQLCCTPSLQSLIRN